MKLFKISTHDTLTFDTRSCVDVKVTFVHTTHNERDLVNAYDIPTAVVRAGQWVVAVWLPKARFTAPYTDGNM